MPEELGERALRPLRLGELRPDGWLRTQLALQADGMAGHLDEFWPDVARSAWFGGDADGWERAPYWLDGVIGLAAVLDDPRLITKLEGRIGEVLDRQSADGWLGPDRPNPDPAHAARFGPYDVWPRMIMLKALLQYHSFTGEQRVITACLRLCRRIDEVLAGWPLYEWGRVRWADLVYGIDQLRELTGETWLADLAERVYRQGYDWVAYAESFPYRAKVTQAMLDDFQQAENGHWMNDRFQDSHGVNVAMGLRSFPVWSRHAYPDRQRKAFELMVDRLEEFHGQATGAFTADEHLAGTHPSQGTETCTVVEQLFSLAVALETWGPDEQLIDRWERLAFNALPAAARTNECGHQYDQQANQVECRPIEDRIYSSNGPDANVFGLAPHFGCCTANRHQGWPKFAARMWMRTPEDDLLALTYSPCRIETRAAGGRLRIEVGGSYPFADRVPIEVTGDDATGSGTLRFRIPAWAENPTIMVDQEPARPVSPGSVVPITRDWSGSHLVELRLPAGIRIQDRPSSAVSVRRGPVIFALAVAERWEQLGGEEPYGDWSVHPESRWNYSLELDRNRPDRSLRVDTCDTEPTLSGPVYAPDSAPLRIRARARVLPEWTLEHGAAAAPPPSPCRGDGPPEEVILLPYGAARLRITDLPWHEPEDPTSNP